MKDALAMVLRRRMQWPHAAILYCECAAYHRVLAVLIWFCLSKQGQDRMFHSITKTEVNMDVHLTANMFPSYCFPSRVTSLPIQWICRRLGVIMP